MDISQMFPSLGLPQGLLSAQSQRSPLLDLLGPLFANPAQVTGGAPQPPRPMSPAQAVPSGIAAKPQPQGVTPMPSVTPTPTPSGPGAESVVGRLLSSIFGPGEPAPIGAPMPPNGVGLGDIIQRAAEAGIPPPPSVSSPNVTPATVGGTPPQGQVGAPPEAAANLPSPAGTAITPTLPTQPASMTTFPDLSAMYQSAIAPNSVSRNPSLGTPARATASANAVVPKAEAKPEAKKGDRPNSALSAVRPPPNPTGINPSTPAAIQPRAVDLDPMNALLARVLAMRQQQTVLPQLSEFLTRRPQS